jgi:hypothetical protein
LSGCSRCSCCLLTEVNGTTRWLWDRNCQSAPGSPSREGDEEGADEFDGASCYQQSGSDANAAPHVPPRCDSRFHHLTALRLAISPAGIPPRAWTSRASLMTGGETPNIATAGGTRRKALDPSA